MPYFFSALFTMKVSNNKFVDEIKFKMKQFEIEVHLPKQHLII
jgi:hypothetical protein